MLATSARLKSCENNWAAGWTRAGSLPAIAAVDCAPAEENVPAMGLAGLAILFAGLVTMTGVARRRVK